MSKKNHVIKHQFFYLFIALLVFFFANAFLSESSLTLTNSIFLIILVAVSLFTLNNHNKTIIVIGIFLGIAVIIISGFSDMVSVPKSVQMFRISLIILFFAAITFICLYSTLEKRRVTANVLFGAAASYLLLGLVFANIFWLIDVSSKQAFNFHHLLHKDSMLQIYTYYSFVTLTTLGYGDITPLSNVARTFAWVEAALGQIYLTILIAQLVGSFIAQKGKIE
ncbi:MAG: potassium channel family protein [Coxiellaceae bacterium]|nr:potassium channel family protein [Coxiellaceae bacterium]